MKIGTAWLEIDGDHKRLDRSIDGVERRMRSRFSKIGKVAALGFGAGIAGAAVAGKSFLDAQIESEKSSARMRAQLKASGKSYARYGDRIDDVIGKQSRLSGLDDEDLQDAFTNIIRTTGDVEESLNLVGLASDFARAKNMDVAKAGELVAKVAGGNTGILSRYGITLKEGATATEALGALQQKFGGQAKAYGATTAGSVDRLNVAWENIKETLGAAIAPTFERIADGAGRIVAEIDEIAKRDDIDVGEKIRLSADVLKERFRPIGRELVRAISNAWPGIQDKMGTLARKAAGAFVKAWLASDWWVKLLTAAFLAKRLGVFSIAGRGAARRFTKSFGTQMAASSAAGTGMSTAAAGAGTAAGTAFSGAMIAAAAATIPTGITFLLNEMAKSEGTDKHSGSSIAGPDSPRNAAQAIAIKVGRELGIDVDGKKKKRKPKRRPGASGRGAPTIGNPRTAPRRGPRKRSGSESGASSIGNQGRRAYGDTHFHLTVAGGGFPDWRIGAVQMADELHRRGG